MELDYKRFPEKAKYQKSWGKTGYISYLAHLRAYGVYSALYGTSQSAYRLSERGGFGEVELDEFYPEWRNYIIEE